MFLIQRDTLLLLIVLNSILIFFFKKPLINVIVSSLFLLFYRLPMNLKMYKNSVLSPAEGKIINIEYIGNKYISISIFLSIFDKHVQIAPMDGIITNIRYKPGEFNAAQFFNKSKFNERMEFYIKTRIGTIKVINYAGMLVRRIQSLKDVKSFIKQTDIISIIKFGSRVDIILPKNKVNLLVKNGDYLRLGQQIALIKYVLK